MNAYFEIAYAAALKRLCFFTGTGFSKAVTENNAPNWQSLLEKLCDLLNDDNSLKNGLFPKDEDFPLSLEESAQVIAIALQQINKDIHEEVANIIKRIELSGDNSSIIEFLSKRSFRVVTTNYDKLTEELISDSKCQTLTPGMPIPKSSSRTKIYHVHGSIDLPKNMVVTSDDYFKFINNESYFSRKLSTVLHENTVVILGYSLSDTNLKKIINDYKIFSRNHVIGSSIFLISRSKVNQHVKDYYAHCYGIRVLDNLETYEFFSKLNDSMDDAEKCVKKSVISINEVITGKAFYKDSYLKFENSFFEIISSISAIGLSIDDERVVKLIGKIIKKKINFTKIRDAWEQYTHLARWLIYIGSIFELSGTSIEDTFLNAVDRSMVTMNNKKKRGYSWHANDLWDTQWFSIIASNRVLVRHYIEKKHKDWKPAIAVVSK